MMTLDGDTKCIFIIRIWSEIRTISRIRNIDHIALLVAPIFLAIFGPKSSEKNPILMILNVFFGKYGNLGNSDFEKMCGWQP